MSAERPQREVAYRLFAREFEDSEYTYAESDEERAPNYVVTPTGARVNRLFVVGVLTEVEPVSDEVLRARIVDPTGAFVVYAGQYQPEALAFFERTDPPAFVAVTGKARTFQPDDADVIYTSIRPESANEVTAETRDRWVVQTAERTIDRVETFAGALELSERGAALEDALRRRGVETSLAAGIPKASEYYGTTSGYLAAIREMALDATRVVAGEIDEVESPTLAPDDGEDEPLDFEHGLPETTTETIDEPQPAKTETASAGAAAEAATDSPATDAESGPSESVEPTSESSADTSTEADATGTEGSTEVESAESKPSSADSEAPGDADTAPVDPDEMYELSESEREEVKSEFGVDFETGNEVADPGEADIDAPEPDDETAPEDSIEEPPETEASEAEAEDVGEEPAETETDDNGADEPDETEPADETAGDASDLDLEDAVVEAMSELDDGDGALRSDLVQTVADRHDVTDEAVEDAIQDALMGGRCYEPAEDRLTPI